MDYTSEFYRLDDLQRGGFKLLQDTREFCFGMDSVLLADFAARDMKKNARAAELCCGNGAVSVLMLARNDSLNITGVELSENSALLAEYNAGLNGIEKTFKVLHCDLKKMPAQYGNSFDAVVVNPPYNVPMRGVKSSAKAKRISRSEEEASLADVLICSKRILKDKGKLYMVHRPTRLDEIVCELSDYSFALKTIRFVYPKKTEKSNVMLLCATKNGGTFTEVLPPLVAYNDVGKYTDEIYHIYYGNSNCHSI